MTEKTKKESIRLPCSIVDFVEHLEKSGVYGRTKSEVYMNLLRDSINSLIEKDFVKKYLETNKILEGEIDDQKN